MASSMANTPLKVPSRLISQTACARCRSQKIKCSRHTPSCKRCEKNGTPCLYPEPPNRKHLAALRAGRVAASLPETVGSVEGCYDSPPSQSSALDSWSSRSEVMAAANDFVLPPTESPSSDRVKCQNIRDYIHTKPSIGQSQESNSRLPDPQIGLLLIEVFFTRFLTASLFFDHRTFVDDYRAERAPEVVLLSIFAVSSLFFRAPPSDSYAQENDLAEFATVYKRGRLWAESASIRVLISADKPSVSNICAGEMLASYWFAVGEMDRAAIHSSLSSESCLILQRKANRRGRSARSIPNQSEVPERIRWACWIKHCMVESGSGYSSLDTLVPSLQSGFYGDSYNREWLGPIQSPSYTFPFQPEAMDWMTWDKTDLKSSAVYIVNVYSLWKEIRTFVEASWESKAASFLPTVFNMDGKLQNFYDTLPDEFKDKALMTNANPEPLQRNAFFICSIYYLCVICLHSSVVPALSGSTIGYFVSTMAVKASAETAYCNARRFTQMARDYISTTPDFTKLPPFIGYCAFYAGSVLGIISDFWREEEGEEFWDGAMVCKLVLRELMVYWPVLGCFWKELDRHFYRRRGNNRPHQQEITENFTTGSHLPVSNERDHRALSAFLHASPVLPAQVDNPFLLRPYIESGGTEVHGLGDFPDKTECFTDHSNQMLFESIEIRDSDHGYDFYKAVLSTGYDAHLKSGEATALPSEISSMQYENGLDDIQQYLSSDALLWEPPVLRVPDAG